MTDFYYDVSSAVLAINPSAQLIVTDENIDTIEWLKGTTPISKSAIQAKQAELKTAYDKLAYQRNRKIEYPSIEDQLDKIYHGGIDGWKVDIKAIKEKYPKPRLIL